MTYNQKVSIFIIGCFVFIIGYTIGVKTFHPIEMIEYVPTSKTMIDCQKAGGDYSIKQGIESCDITTSKNIFNYPLNTQIMK